MASPPPPERGGSWRSRAAPTVPTADRPDGPAWRDLDARPRPLPSRLRLGRLALVLGLIFVTATLFVWVLLWLRPPGPACLLIAGAGYEDNLAIPPNPQGREAMTRLSRMANSSSSLSRLFRGSGRLRLVSAPVEVRQGTDWAAGLDDAGEQTVIVYLALLGGSDAKGAYLLPQDADAASEDRIRLEKILDRLAELPADRHKLLVLDATALNAQWTLGLINNDFARALAELEDRIEAVPNLVVLSSSGVDQRSWPASDLRVSLFTRHLITGLRHGTAIGRNGRLDALTLFEYVAEKVEMDARLLHGVLQTPVLLPRGCGPKRAAAISLDFLFEGSEPETEADADALPDIEAAWAAYNAFRPRAEAAMACVPRDWRLWQAWLVRYERLRMSASPHAGACLEQAQEAAVRVKQGLELGMTADSQTLSMPAVEGQTQLVVPNPYPPMEQLWQANAADRLALWQQLQKADPGEMLRRNVLVALVRRAAENPARNLDRAADIAVLLDDPVRAVRAAEAQFLVLVRRDLAVKPIPEDLNLTLQQGLRLRLAAEAAALGVVGDGYAYSERIRPWIQATIAEADRQRQLGEDLLFSTERADWLQARELFTRAAALYAQTKDDAVALREALAACDRGASELPFQAHWISLLLDDTDDTLLNLALGLFGAVRELERDVAAVMQARDAGKLAAIRQRAQAAKAGLDQLQVHLDAFAQTCESTSASPLRDGGRVLEVPWLGPAVRLSLLRKITRLGSQGRSEGHENVAPTAAQLDVITRRRAVREGRLALAALGAEWFAETAGDGRLAYGDVEPFVRRPDLEGVWSQVMRWAGDQIGARFRLLPPKVDALVAQARQDKAIAPPLRQADRLARRLDPGQWQRGASDAPVMARQADVETLLVGQAERTWTDHWYNDDPKAEPYYRISGLAYLRDARRLDPFGRADAPGADAVRKQLEAPDGLTLAPRPVSPMIVGDRLPVTAGVGGSVVTGYPMLWAEPEALLSFGKLQDGGRAKMQVQAGKPDERHTVTLTSPELERAEQTPPGDASPLPSGVDWQAYYRGQKPAATVPVLLYPVAESTRESYPPPDRAGIALRATDALFARYGEAKGSLAVVVDVSGSEGPVADAQAVAKSRYRQAVQALRTILGKVPRGTRLSLWVFGQAVPPRNSVEQAEATIRRLRDPAEWIGGEEAVEALVGQVAGLEPWNQSPIARAVLRAREDLLKADGFRSMIVLSDGDDNRFATDKEANPKKETIADVLTARLADTRIAVHFVGFSGSDGQPEADLIANFGFVSSRIPKGTISTVTRLAPVLEAIQQTMPVTLRYQVGGSPVIDVSRTMEADRWTFVPGGPEKREVRVPLLGFDRPVVLRGGDNVLIEIDQKNAWRRLLWSKQGPLALRPAREANGWRAAVLQDQLLGARALQMLVTLEKQQVGEDPAQVYPGSVWLETTPVGGGRPAVRWGELFGYPAPAWGIDAPGWPITATGPAAPVVGAWWGKAAEGEKVDLSEVRVEEHWVQVRADRREKRWCAVVESRHEVGKPVWARFDGLTGVMGQEDRHFLAAGRYMGLVWFQPAADEAEVRRRVNRELTGVRLVSVQAFKEAARRSGDVAEFRDLETPAAVPPRPPAAGR